VAGAAEPSRQLDAQFAAGSSMRRARDLHCGSIMGPGSERLATNHPTGDNDIHWNFSRQATRLLLLLLLLLKVAGAATIAASETTAALDGREQ
jgi:hypothetical protein